MQHIIYQSSAKKVVCLKYLTNLLILELEEAM